MPKVSLSGISRKDLEVLHNIFSEEFADEPGCAIQQKKFERLRKYFYLLYPLQVVSPTIRNYFRIRFIKFQAHIIGFISYSLQAGQRIHIEYFAISSKWQKRGLGQQALTLFIEELQKNGKFTALSLEVDDTIPAYRLYQKMGFTKLKTNLYFEIPVARIRRATLTLPLILKAKATQAEIQALYQASIGTDAPPLWHVYLANLKNKLLGYKKYSYYFYDEEKLASLIEIRSYPQAQLFTMLLLIDPATETLRTYLLGFAMMKVRELADSGTISTTVLRQSPAKEQAILGAGFACTEVYHYMEYLLHPAATPETASAAIPAAPPATTPIVTTLGAGRPSEKHDLEQSSPKTTPRSTLLTTK